MKSPKFPIALFTLAWFLLLGSSIWYCLILKAAISYQDVHKVDNVGKCTEPVRILGFPNSNPLAPGVKACEPVGKASTQGVPLSAIPLTTEEPLKKEEAPLSPPPAKLPEVEDSAVDPPAPTIPKTTTKLPEEAVPLPEEKEPKVEAEVKKTPGVVEKHEDADVLPPPPPPLPSVDETHKVGTVEPPKDKEPKEPEALPKTVIPPKEPEVPPKKPDGLPEPIIPVKKAEDPPKKVELPPKVVASTKEPLAAKVPSDKGSPSKHMKKDQLGTIHGWG